MLDSFFFCAVIFILGACIASFLNASALRLTNNQESILSPSRCRGCDKNLSWRELVPIISWLMQQGRCSCKKTTLSPQYLFVEVSLGVTFVVLYQVTPTLPSFIFYSILSGCLFFCLLTDALHQLLYMPVILFCLAVGLTFSWGEGRLLNACIGASIGFLLLWSINLAYKKFRGQDGLGGGDKYLLAAIGGWFGFPAVLEILVLASWIGAGWAILLVLNKRLPKALPLGVFLVLATPLIALKLFVD